MTYFKICAWGTGDAPTTTAAESLAPQADRARVAAARNEVNALIVFIGFSLAKCGLLRGGRWPGCEAVLRSKASDCRGEAGDPTLIARREETHSEFDGFRERVRGLRLAVPQRWSTSRLSMSPMSWTIWTMTTMTTTMMMRTDHTLWLYP